MQFYPKNKDPRLDDRGARENGRKIKTGLLNLNIVSSYYGVDIERASNQVTWDSDKDKWCSRDEMMGSCHIIADDKAVFGSHGTIIKTAENRFDKELAFICSDIYNKAQIHSMIDWQHPAEKLAKGKSVYHIRWWIAEMGDNIEKAVFKKGLEHRFFDKDEQNLLEIA